MLLVKKFAPTNFHDEKNEQIAPSLQQLLKGQGYEESPGFKPKCHGIRLGTLDVGSLCERKTKCVKS